MNDVGIIEFNKEIEEFKDGWNSFEVKALTLRTENMHRMICCYVTLSPDEIKEPELKTILDTNQYYAFAMRCSIQRFNTFLDALCERRVIRKEDELILRTKDLQHIKFESAILERYYEHNPTNKKAFYLYWADYTSQDVLGSNGIRVLERSLQSNEYKDISDFCGSFWGYKNAIGSGRSCGIFILAPIDAYISKQVRLKNYLSVKVSAGVRIKHSDLKITFMPKEGAQRQDRSTLSFDKVIKENDKFIRHYAYKTTEPNKAIALLHYRNLLIDSVEPDQSGKVPLSVVVDKKPPLTPKRTKTREENITQSIIWDEIEQQFGETQTKFGKKISFIKGKYKREIIFRDVAHAYGCYKKGFYKPVVILAGGVIEELIRCYLESKNINPEKDGFFHYIKACREKEVLKKSISSLSDSVREFRNLVHIKKEESKRQAISQAAALSAISNIFVVSNDFIRTV